MAATSIGTPLGDTQDASVAFTRRDAVTQGVDVAIVAALLIAAMAWIAYSATIPPLADYPYDLALFFIHARAATDQFLSQYYEPFWRFQPNLGLDGVAYTLNQFFDIHTTGRSVVWITYASLVAGCVAVHRVLHGYFSVVSLMASVLIFNRYFASGFLEYMLSLGWGFIAFAAWMALRERPVARLILGTALAFGVYLGHLYAFGVYAVCVGCCEANFLLRDFRPWPWLRARCAIALAHLLPSIAVFLFVSPTASGIRATEWRPLVDKLAGPIVLLPGYDLPLELLLLGLPCLALAIAWRWRMATLRRDFLLAVAAFTVLYFVMPDILFSSYGADRRLLIPIALLALLSFNWPAASARVRVLQWALVVGIVGAQLAHVAVTWRSAEPEFAALDRLTAKVERGAKVAGTTIIRSDQYLVFPPLHEIVSLFVVERSAYVPRLWAYPIDAGAPLRYTPGYVTTTLRPPVIYVPANGTDAEIQNEVDEFVREVAVNDIDYVLVVDLANAKIQVPATYELIGATGMGRLFRVRGPKPS